MCHIPERKGTKLTAHWVVDLITVYLCFRLQFIIKTGDCGGAELYTDVLQVDSSRFKKGKIVT